MSHSQGMEVPLLFHKGYLLGIAWGLFHFIHSSNMCDYLVHQPKKQPTNRQKNSHVNESLRVSEKWQDLKIKPKNYTNNLK